MSAPGRQLSEAIDYASLREGLRARAREIGITRQAIDHIGRLSDGHAGGLLAENSNRALGIRSLGKILKALGVRLLLVEDPETTARTARLMGRKRSEPQAVEGEKHWRSKRKPSKTMRAAAHTKAVPPATVSDLGRCGARALNASMTATERSAAASRAASARWARPASARPHGAGA